MADVVDALDRLKQALEQQYTIERELGRGGMATVWLAQDLRHRRPVALKVLHPELSAGLGPERFVREIHLAARLQHPHILPVFDSGSTESGGLIPLLWYTMPYVDGESLRTRLRHAGQMSMQDAVRIAREVGEALQYAHEQGVVHRDVKPENILLSRGHALLADFGIARAFEGGVSETLTGAGVAIGTPAYMSPEQAMGERNLDGRSDIYSLGCVLYEMLAGQPPHSAPTPQAVLVKRFTEDPAPIQRHRPGVPTTISAALDTALQKDTDRRFRTAGEFVEALSRADGGHSTRVSRPIPNRRRTSRQYGFAALGALVLVGATAAILSHTRAQPNALAGGHIRLAVLPFETVGDSSRAYLGEGLADGLRDRLARLSVVEVIAGSSTREYRHARKPAQQIGRELGVPYLVNGRVHWDDERNGDKVLRLSPQVIRTANGVIRTLPEVQSRAAALPQLQNELALRIVEALGIKLSPSDRARLTDTMTTNPEAFAAYLRGQDYLDRVSRWDAPKHLIGAAIDLFRRAIELDSSFVDAKVALARAYRAAARTGVGDSTAYRTADSLLEQVLQERPELPEALAARGDIRRDQGDLAQATRLFERAVELKPSDADLLGRLSFLQALQLDSSAVETGARAVMLAPRDPATLRTVIAGTSVFRHFTELEQYSDRLIDLDPRDVLGYVHKALVQLMARGDTAAAVRSLRQTESMVGQIPFVVAWVYAMSGPSGWQRWHHLSLEQLASPGLLDSLQYYWYQALVSRVEGRTAAVRGYSDSVAAMTRDVRQQSQDYPFQLAMRSYAEALRNQWPKARTDLANAEAALRRLEPSAQASYQVAFVAANAELGDTSRALAAARWLLEEPTIYTRKVLPLSAEFAGLWKYPEFGQLVRDSTLP